MTDSASERTAVSPSSGGTYPVYELSSERISRQKGPGESSGDVSTEHRKSLTPRQPLVVVDRGLKMLFGREPAAQEIRASAVDVEVSFFRSVASCAWSPRLRNLDRRPHRDKHRCFSSRSRRGRFKGPQNKIPSLDLAWHVLPPRVDSRAFDTFRLIAPLFSCK